ncbi:hypothetical protein ANCCEY_12380 [Ancylostoma ceylanicum]|uniref:Uncharacterized protein n=1 Tax=Ancylostoma ceylanicum TaxID=53326 RepID=A0A0D6LF28_9BILA|nr:hypothetical protein ANCCEY_12380 [Ancylostoma ceylanicum]
MWDEHDKKNIERVSNCDLFGVAVMQRDASVILPFSIAYTRNNNYIVLKLRNATEVQSRSRNI